jgi:hypothetical protein
MNRIIREHYPASKLPDDLRDGVDPSATVTVTIVEEGKASGKGDEPGGNLGASITSIQDCQGN